MQPDGNRKKMRHCCRSGRARFDASVGEATRAHFERKECAVRFFGYTLGDESIPIPQAGPEDMEKMGRFVEEATKAGVIVATGGIGPTAMGAKITLENGQYTVVDGPFAEAKELIGGWALMECRDKNEAVEWSKRFLGVLGHGEVRVRPVFGPE
jgi:hypothetical protein